MSLATLQIPLGNDPARKMVFRTKIRCTTSVSLLGLTMVNLTKTFLADQELPSRNYSKVETRPGNPNFHIREIIPIMEVQTAATLVTT